MTSQETLKKSFNYDHAMYLKSAINKYNRNNELRKRLIEVEDVKNWTTNSTLISWKAPKSIHQFTLLGLAKSLLP